MPEWKLPVVSAVAISTAVIFLFKYVHNQDAKTRKSIPAERRRKTPATSEITEVLTPNQTDPNGVAMGGVLMSWIDICAGIAAKTHSDTPCVTASVDAVHFLRPIRMGDVVVVKARVNRSWTTSLEVGVAVFAEDILTGEQRYCCHAYLTFVGVQNGRPIVVPELVPLAQEEIEECAAADRRRIARMELKTKSEAHRSLTTVNINLPFTENMALIMPQHANSVGITFGGYIIQLMEQCGIISASRHVQNFHNDNASSSRILFRTASIDCLNFIRPTKVGDILRIRAQVTRTWNTSLEVYITVHAHLVGYNETIIVDACGDDQWDFSNDGFMTFFAIDSEDHKSHERLPSVQSASPETQECQDLAEKRRQKRLNERDYLLKQRRFSNPPARAEKS